MGGITTSSSQASLASRSVLKERPSWQTKNWFPSLRTERVPLMLAETERHFPLLLSMRRVIQQTMQLSALSGCDHSLFSWAGVRRSDDSIYQLLVL